MTYEVMYDFMCMKNIMKSYLKSWVSRFQMTTVQDGLHVKVASFAGPHSGSQAGRLGAGAGLGRGPALSRYQPASALASTLELKRRFCRLLLNSIQCSDSSRSYGLRTREDAFRVNTRSTCDMSSAS